MSFTNQTTHYGLPQWIGSDKPTYLVDQNNAYQTIDAEIYNANTTAGAAQTAAEGAVATAGAASTTAADALTAAQTASSTADSALTEAQTANTNAQAAQTAAGAAQTAAQAAQEAAAGNSITNLAPAYDPTITYAVDDLVTAEGKLYKCIVAVVTPEQFDINKWDDVTTSEVYLRHNNYSRYVGVNSVSATSDSSLTNSTFLAAKIPELLTTIKSNLNAGEIAVLESVATLNHNLSVVTIDTINTVDNIPSFIEMSATSHAYNTTGIDLLSIIYANNAVTISAAQILSDNSVTYDDLNSVTNSTDLVIFYKIYSSN